MIKTLLVVLLSLGLLLVSSGSARTVNIEANVACRPELLPFLPGRIREICSSLRLTQPNYYFNSGDGKCTNFFFIRFINSQER